MWHDFLAQALAPVATTVLLALCAFGVKIYRMLAQILHQLFPNGGGSLFDKVTGIENAVNTHDAKFKAYQDADRVQTFEADQAGRITWTNTGIEKLFKRSPDEMQGFDWLNGVEPSEQESVGRRYKEAIADRRGFDCNLLLRDGTWVHMVANPIGFGKSACYAGHCRPIDDAPLFRK